MNGAADREVDLASRWLGGSVVAASDESFGDKENLLNPAEAAFEPGRYGNRGEIVDGWETRRRREGGHDWALIRLGAPGRISEVVVDTSFFTGNYPEQCTLAACGREGYPSPDELTGPATEWAEIVPRSALRGDARNVFPVSDPHRFTHVLLSVFPDGGVARLRVHGEVVPDPRGLESVTTDLAGQEYGGLVVASSDDFYTAAQALNRPGRARSMGEGWETRRRRDDGHDFAIFRLAFAGRVRRLVVDTAHFRYNASAAVAAWGCDADPGAATPRNLRRSPGGATLRNPPQWREILARTRLQPDTRHVFAVNYPEPVAGIRIDAFPDGGISRVRVIGSIDPAARRDAGYRWFNTLPLGQLLECLAGAGVPQQAAAHIADQRPITEAWLADLRARAAPEEGGPVSYARALAEMLEGASVRP